MSYLKVAAFGVSSLAVLASPALAGSYTYSLLNQVPEVIATGINSHDLVVGYSADNTTNLLTSFTWQAGQLSVVPTPNPRKSLRFTAINDRGRVVGDYGGRDQTANGVAYRTSDGKLLPVLARDKTIRTSTLAGISDTQLAVGEANVVAQGGGPVQVEGLLVQGRVIQTVPFPPAFPSGADEMGVSPSGTPWWFLDDHAFPHPTRQLYEYAGGQLVAVAPPARFALDNVTSLTSDGRFTGNGSIPKSSPAVGFVYDPASGSLTKVSYPGASTTLVFAVAGNAVLGTYSTASSTTKLFKLVGGQYFTLQPPIPANTNIFFLTSVNASGDFVANYGDSGSEDSIVAICAADQQPCTQ